MSGLDDTPKEGSSNLDPKTKGIDSPDASKNPHNDKVGGKVKIEKKSDYLINPTVYNDQGVDGTKVSRENNAPYADDPSSASAPPGTDLPTAIQTADPSGISQALKKMMPLLAMALKTMQSHSNASNKRKTTNALSKALISLSNQYGFMKVITVFELCLASNGISQLDPDFQTIVKESIADLINAAVKNKSIYNLPEDKHPEIVYGTLTPNPVYTYDNIPDLYIQQYYTSNLDPYPGYIQWLGPNGDYVYNVRSALQYPYTNADDEVIGQSQLYLMTALSIYIVALDPNPSQTLTPAILNQILSTAHLNLSNSSTEKSLGKNSSSKLMSLLPSLIGAAAPLVNKTTSTFLPVSNLNAGSINQTLQKYSQNMAIVKKIQQQSSGAFKLPTSLSSLQSLSNLGVALPSVGIPTLSVQNISKTIGINVGS